MTFRKFETVNPSFHIERVFPPTNFKMNELRFPSLPDDTLKGSRYYKRQMIPNEENKDEIGYPRESFLWKNSVETPKDFQTHFDHKSFMQSHGHLLPISDHSEELEKNLRNRRKRLATISSIDSKGALEYYTSADELNPRMDISSPYDELTYEETLFEVNDDRIQARSETSNDDQDSELTPVNESMVLSINRHKRQKINDMEPHTSSERNSSRFHIGRMSQPVRHSQRKYVNDSVNARIAHQTRHSHKNFRNHEENVEDLISENILEEYIQERIKAVELQIRDEVMRDTISTQRNTRRPVFQGVTLLDKVPEQYSVELEQADESSRDSLLKEIAAVLVSKGYVANAGDSNNLPRELAKLTRGRNSKPDQRNKDNSIESGKSFKKFGDVDHKDVKKRRYPHTLSPPSTFKSHNDSSRQPTSLESSRGSIKLIEDSTTIENIDGKRKKLKSCGSRSSLTSLIRTQESSSSSDETTIRRSLSKRAGSSSIKSSILSNDSTEKKSIDDTPQAHYDNINIVAEIKQKEKKSSKTNEAKDASKNDKNILKAINSSPSELKETEEKSSSVDAPNPPLPPVCPPPPPISFCSVSTSTHDHSVLTNESDASPRPAPPPRRKAKSNASSSIITNSHQRSANIGNDNNPYD